MPTKAQLEQANKEALETIKQHQQEILHLSKCVRYAELALRIAEKDLQLKIDWREGDEDRSEREREDPDREQMYQETGGEQAERFERGIDTVIARIQLIRDNLKAKQSGYDFRSSTWQLGTGE